MTSPDPLLAGLGTAIRTLRCERGKLSQEQLGLDSGVHRNYISGIECGRRKPSLQAVAKLSAGLGLAPSQLIARAETLAETHGASWPVKTADKQPDTAAAQPDQGGNEPDSGS